MSIDVLQDKIRKMKNPCAVVFTAQPEVVPPAFLEDQGSVVRGIAAYCCRIMDGIRDMVPAVRVDFASFALLGTEGIEALTQILTHAKKLGFYVILDWLWLEGAAGAQNAARMILKNEVWPCDAVNLCGYAGSDGVKPYITAAADKKKDVFVTIKTSNKSGSELQDLQTGGRVVYTAAADLVNRWGETAVGRCGYSRVGAVVGANHSVSNKTLRQKYPRLFLLVDGMDAPGCNARNASLAFDNVGHGALCCCGSIMSAWIEADPGMDPVEAAAAAVERLKRNINRYIIIL